MRILFCFFSLALSEVAIAQLCEVVAGSVALGPRNFSAGQVIVDCRGTAVPVDAGRVEICHYDAQSGNACFELPDKGVEDIGQLASESNTDRSVIERLGIVVYNIFTGNPDRVRGGSRLNDTEYLSGFPYAEILMPVESLRLDTSFSTAAPVTNFRLLDPGNGNPLFEQGSANNIIAIPASVFAHDGRYRWQMTSGGQDFQGRFSVVPHEDQQEFDRELRLLLQTPGLGPYFEARVKAALARDFGYTFDAALVENGLRSEITSMAE